MCDSMDEDLRGWLALYFFRDLTLPQKFQLLQIWPQPASMLTASASDLEKSGLSADAIAAVTQCGRLLGPDEDQQIADVIAWQRDPNHHVVTLDDPDYPQALRELDRPPLLLFVAGNADLLITPQIAMVGSRNASAAGIETATSLAGSLVNAGLVVTSGLALGIDSASHSGALAAGGGTIAVFGCGIDIIYPRRNRRLAEQILERGALVSEFPLGMQPRRENFPRRNRIVSGLSQGVLVVEAALRSGSLISANYAAQQGREVFAVPGSIYNPQSRGCHKLIREGAKLVETVDDILEELQLSVSTADRVAPDVVQAAPDLSEIEYQVLVLVEFDPITLDVLAIRSGLSPEQLGQILISLELKNQVQSVAGGYVLTPGLASMPRDA